MTPAKTPVDTILYPRWLYPNPGQAGWLDYHACVIDKGRVVAICPDHLAKQQYHPREVVNLPQHMLIPGLINAHTHLAMNLFKGFADDLPLHTWLHDHIWPAERRHLSESFVETGSRLAMAECIRAGVTCFNDMYFFPETIAAVAQDIGLRGCVGLTVMDQASAWAQSAEHAIDKGLALLNRGCENSLLKWIWAPHAVYTVPQPYLSTLADLSRQYGCRISIHCQETEKEVQDSLSETSKRPLRRLIEAGLPLNQTLLVHMTQVNDEDLADLRECGPAYVVHCPESNLKLASGCCPIGALTEAGVTITLGTDSAASNNDLDLFSEMRLAAYLGKCHARSPELFKTETLMAYATVNAAEALGWSSEIGRLSPGLSADCVAIDLSSIDTVPVYSPLSQIVYSCHPQHVSHVWVNGRCLLKEKALTTIDEGQLLQDVDLWRRRIIA